MRRLALLLIALSVSCAGPSRPANPLAVDQAVRALLRPFQVERGVVCDELLIEITANFNEMVTRPAVDARSPKQQMAREDGAGHVEYRWVNLGDGLDNPFTFMVVGTETYACALNEFVALRSARLRILEVGELTFRITAQGQVTIGGGGQRREVQEFRIDNGRVEGN